MFVNVETYVACDSDRVRKFVDNKLRNKLLDSDGGSMPIPMLYGPSAFGTQFCVYEYTPEGRSLLSDLVTNTAPRDRWNLDISELEGEARLKEVVGHIRQMVAKL